MYVGKTTFPQEYSQEQYTITLLQLVSFTHIHYTFILCVLVTTKQCSYDIFVFWELAYFTKHSSLLQVDPFCWKRWGFILFVVKSYFITHLRSSLLAVGGHVG